MGNGPISLVAGDFTGDGHTDLAVANQASDDVSVLLGNGDGTFQAPVTYGVENNPSVGDIPSAIVAGNFTGDGRTDLAVANQNSNDVSVLFGNGDGTFQNQVTNAVGSDPVALVTGDFNGDGRTDLAVANAGSDDVSVLLGNGNGTFQNQVTYAVGSEPVALVTGDFNGDGCTDLAVANSVDNTVSVLLGNGNGTFQNQVTYAVGIDPTAIVAGDFTGDGRTDLAVADAGGWDLQGNPHPSGVSVLLGNGDGTFQPQVQYATVTYPDAIVAGDFTGDGHTDLAVETPFGDESVLLGNGNGTFQSPVPSNAAVSFPATNSVSGDFNGDGRTDQAYVSFGSDDVSILLGNGDGTFTPTAQMAMALHATPLVADVNGDGTSDMLVVDAAGDILYRQGVPGEPGSFQPPVTVNPGHPARDIAYVSTSLGGVIAAVDAKDNAVSLYAYRAGSFVQLGSIPTGQLPAQIVAGDLFGDGGNDLVVRNAGDGTLTMIPEGVVNSVLGVGSLDGSLPITTLPVGMGVSDVALVDTTGSGVTDIMVTNQLTGLVSVLRNQGGGAFSPPVPYRASAGLAAVDTSSGSAVVTSQEATSGVVAGAFTTGAPIDLVTANPGSNTLGFLAGLGAGRFANPVNILTAEPAQVVRVADFNHDGVPDIAVLGTDSVSVYLGNGQGGFSAPVVYNAGLDPTGLTVADLGHDGNLDLLIGNAYGDVLTLAGQGDGTFRPLLDVGDSVALAVADLTGNGTKDVIYADQGLDRVVVDYGGGQSKSLGATSGLLAPGAVTVADLNGDGIPDLIVANSGGNNVLVYPGLGNGQFGPALNGGKGFFTGTDPVGVTVANLNGRPDLVIADKGSNDVTILLNQATADGGFTFVPGPRLNLKTATQQGLGPVATAIVPSPTGGPSSLAVSLSGSNQVWVIPSVGGGFFKDQNPTIYDVGSNPGPIFVSNFDGKPDLVTVNAGSNDLTLISDFLSSSSVTSVINSGGFDPVAAISFPGNNGFDDLIVANNGDGHLALLEGSAEGLFLSSLLESSDLPSPTDLAYSGLSDGQVTFYATTAGREAATLLSFALGGGDVAPDTSTPVPSVNTQVVNLSSLRDSALPLIATLLTTTSETSATALDQAAYSSEASPSLSGTPITAGQSPEKSSGAGNSDDGEVEAADESKATTPSPGESPVWQPPSPKLEDDLDQFCRDHLRQLLSPDDPATRAPVVAPAPTTERQDGASSSEAKNPVAAVPGEAFEAEQVSATDFVPASNGSSGSGVSTRTDEGAPDVPAPQRSSHAWTGADADGLIPGDLDRVPDRGCEDPAGLAVSLMMIGLVAVRFAPRLGAGRPAGGAGGDRRGKGYPGDVRSRIKRGANEVHRRAGRPPAFLGA